VLFDPSGTITITSAQQCVDDDVGLATIAEVAGLDTTACEDSIEFCDFTDDIEGPLVRNMCCETCACSSGVCGTAFCSDVDAQIVASVAAKAGFAVNDCSDLAGSEACTSTKNIGKIARGLCCATCNSSGGASIAGFDGDDSVVAETKMPPVVDDSGKDFPPVQLFLVAGQSECVGGAIANDLERSDRYSNLKGVVDGVWFAGYDEYASPDRFFIAPMSAMSGRPKFGPELAFGQRLQAAGVKNNRSRQQIMMVKYCVGGTNVNTHWNPNTAANSWNKNQDDGTSQWLEENGNLLWLPVKTSKNFLFKNMAYTIRRTEEALTKAGIPYKWKSIVWLQGGADKDKTGGNDRTLWKTFGEDTARVFNGFREELGSAVPIVDTGGSSYNQLLSGKEYASQIVDGCQATSVDFPFSASDDSPSNCNPSASNPCADVPGRFFNYDLFEYYGYDPNWPNKPANAKTFNWWVRYPNNLHSAFEGMILKGHMLANEYMRKFTDYNLNYFEDDVSEVFPFEACPGNSIPNENNFCWIDHREELQMEGNLCPPLNNSPTREPTLSPPNQNPAPNPVTSPTMIPVTKPAPSPISIPATRPVAVIPPVASPSSNPTLRPTQKPAPNPVASPTMIPVTKPAPSPISIPTTRPVAVIPPFSNPTLRPSQKPAPNPVTVDSVSNNNPTTDTPTAFATSSPTAFGTNSPTEIPDTGNIATNPTPTLDLDTTNDVLSGFTGILFSQDQNSQSDSSAASMNHALATSNRWWLLLVVSAGIMALTAV